MIDGGARTGVARTQQPGECFAGGVEIGEQRMEPEPALVRRRRLFLVRMRADQGGVDIDHIEPRIRARGPRLGPRRRLEPS